jgi:hypothetical protein
MIGTGKRRLIMSAFLKLVVISELTIVCLPGFSVPMLNEAASTKWCKVLSQESLESVSDYIKNSTDTSWPHIFSERTMRTAQNHTAAATADRLIELASHVQTSVTAFATVIEGDLSRNSLSAASTCGRLSTIIRDGGGISNLALSDSIVRLVLANLISSVITRPHESDFHRQVLETIQVPRVDPEELRLIAVEEGDPSPDISGLPVSAALRRMMLPGDWNDRSRGFDPHNVVFGAPTSVLIKEGHIGSLIWRLISTRKIHGKILPALIEFTEKGGNLDQLYTMTNAEFSLFMGPETLGVFRFEELDEVAVTVGEIRVVLRDFEKGWSSTIFYKLAANGDLMATKE